MTVTYTAEVANCKGLGNFLKLLFRWRGSVYKLVWPDLLIYVIIYYSISFIYRYALDGDQRQYFENVSLYCQNFSDQIPVSFVLGFYVSLVIKRWWDQYLTLPWPSSLSLFVSTYIQGQDERGRLMRRTIVRYANLSFAITYTMISPPVKKRFPTFQHLVEAGLMTASEKKIFEDMLERSPINKYWMPFVWAGAIVSRARKEGRIRDDFQVKTIIDEINKCRSCCGGLMQYDTISIPLVYTQVVTLAVYSFFLSTLMGRQFLDPSKDYSKHSIDLYVPIFTFLQFFFYMGWLKVAESLVNPFGEDDDDFEVNGMIDRNLQVSYLIVDEMHNEHPEMVQDIYWDEVCPQELPYTVASEQYRREPPQGSTANIEVPQEEQEFLPLLKEENETIDDDEILADGGSRSGSVGINIPGSKYCESGRSSRASSRPSPKYSRKNSILTYLQNSLLGSYTHGRTTRGSVRRTSSRRSRLSYRPSMTSHSKVSTSPPLTSSMLTQDSDLTLSSSVEAKGVKSTRGIPFNRSANNSKETEGDLSSTNEGRLILGAEEIPLPTDPGSDNFVIPLTKKSELPRDDHQQLMSQCSIQTTIFSIDDDDSKGTGSKSLLC